MGFVSFNDLDLMESSVKESIEQARLIGKSETILAETPVIRDDVKADIINDIRDVSLEKKLEILKAYNGQILETHENIISSGVRYRDGFKREYFGNSEGTLISQEKMDVGCNLSARSARENVTQMAYTSVGSSRDFNVVLGLENKVKEAFEIAVQLLDAPSIKAGKYITICDPHLAGTFAHEAFGHSSEAEKVYENKRLYELMKFGTMFGSPVLNIYDSGLT